MNICMIIPSFYPATVYGGPIFSTLNTCKELVKIKGVNVYVSTTNASMKKRLDVEVNKYLKIKENFFVKYYNETVVNRLSIALLFGIAQDIRKSDIVHIQSIFSISTIVSLFFSIRYYDKPVVLSSRGQLGSWCLNQGSRFKGAWLKYFISPFAHKIVWHAASSKERNDILSIFPSVNAVVITNGVSLSTFNNSNELNSCDYIARYVHRKVNNVDKIVVSMGRLQKVKGFDILITAFSMVTKEYPNAYLLIAGPDESEGMKLKNLIVKLGMIDNVFLIGNIDGQSKVDFFANADLFVLPSHHENFGNVYVESLASGTPIIASHGTPWSEVEEFQCGQWVENNVDKVCGAMRDMLSRDKNELRDYSVSYAKKFDWSVIAGEFHKLFVGMTKVSI